MPEQHIVKRGNTWYYHRRRPKKFEDIGSRSLISFSLKTSDPSQAKLLAAQISLKLELKWRSAKERGVSLTANDEVIRFTAAVDVTKNLGLTYRTSEKLSDQELLHRLRLLINGGQTAHEQKAVLGMAPQPKQG